ncbi:MAG: serine/threonine-protein kinase [Acidobacteriota bacterium]|nr:serine/threonine-protein kinase [Acidobacteriota bacterium]
MNLPAGTKLGPYEVLALLGVGGMGEVYRARDTRLDRIVAVKILRSGITASDNLRARFEREARAISHLTHPNICALYDVGNQDGSEYLVMEYVEGETLADKLSRGPLPTSLVLRYGAQIAEALQHAHRAGIAHRDLKPGNVMITTSGAKLLDFGLAKFVEPAHVFSDQSAPETARPLTHEGAIVGTFQYMSPEQLHGAAVDHRSDIFSLGIVLYEMTTGQRPFPASSSASLIAAILSSDPIPLRSLQPAAPAALERIILTALEKNPEERWQTAQDVARQLRWLAESSPSTEGLAVAAMARRRQIHPAAAIAIAAAAALLTYAAMKFFSPSQAPATQAHLQFVPPEGLRSVESPESPNFALSPDGKTLCFVGREGTESALYIRALDSPAIRRLQGTENAFAPFWSSDGRWIAYSAGGKLWKTQAAGSSVPQPICDVALNGAVGTWNGDTILFADRSGGRREIYRVADSGGTPVLMRPLNANEARHSWPLLLPDGRHYLYQSSPSSMERQILLATLEGNESSVLLRNVSHVALLSGDRLTYVRDGKLMAQRFDPGRGTVLGEPELIAEDVSYFYLSGRAIFSAANGVVVYRTYKSTGRLTLTDRSGKNKRALDDTGLFYDVALSRDGKRAAATITSRATGLGDIWIYDLARGVKDRFTSEPGFELHAVWAPDGRSIVYSDAPGGALPHLVHRSLSSATSENVMPPGPFQFAGSFGDASTLFYHRLSENTNYDVLRHDMKTGASAPLLVTDANETEPQVSPDGKWLAFTSDVSGGAEVYLVSLSVSHAERIRISLNGGYNPRWSADSGELFYLSDKRIMRAVPRAPGDWSDVSVEELFAAPPDARTFAASPDGKSFLFTEMTANPSDAFFNVVLGR